MSFQIHPFLQFHPIPIGTSHVHPLLYSVLDDLSHDLIIGLIDLIGPYYDLFAVLSYFHVNTPTGVLTFLNLTLSHAQSKTRLPSVHPKKYCASPAHSTVIAVATPTVQQLSAPAHEYTLLLKMELLLKYYPTHAMVQSTLMIA